MWKFFNLKNSLTRTYFFLVLFGIVAIADLLIPTSNPQERAEYIIKIIFTFLTSGVIFYIVHYGFNLTASNPVNFGISTWIVFLLIHPTNNLWIFPFAIISIALGKLLFRKNKLPIFNPAAMALTITYVVSKIVNIINPESDTLLISWWGADMFQNITRDIPVVSVVLPLFFFFGFLYFANSFKKIPYVLSFLGSFLVLSFAFIFATDSMERAVSFVSLALFNATAFCALVMIPEPKTSPNFMNQQIIVGIIAGISLFIFNWFLGSFPVDPLINSILVANIATLIMKQMSQRPKPAVQTTTPITSPTQVTTS